MVGHAQALSTQVRPGAGASLSSTSLSSTCLGLTVPGLVGGRQGARWDGRGWALGLQFGLRGLRRWAARPITPVPNSAD